MLNELEQESAATEEPKKTVDQALDEEENKDYYNSYSM